MAKAEPTRKDLVVFALMLPAFCALLGWLSVRRPSGLMIAFIIVVPSPCPWKSSAIANSCRFHWEIPADPE